MFDLPGITSRQSSFFPGGAVLQQIISPLRPLFRCQPTRTSAAAWRGFNAQFYRDFSVPFDKRP
jgi:hypothetical protein